MRTVNMHEAKMHLSRLVKAAAEGEPFIITRDGKPMVKVVAVEAPGPGTVCRIRFGEFKKFRPVHRPSFTPGDPWTHPLRRI